MSFGSSGLDHQRCGDIRKQRRCRDGVTDLLHDGDQLDKPEADAAVLLVDRQPCPTELDQLVPEVLVVGSVGRSRPDALERGARGE
ncbi:MAG TPA: hypothetical protein VGG41_13115 [Solirubrobacteraceae bacterium]